MPVWHMPYKAYMGHITPMANDQKRSAKTEVLSMRMDPKTRFQLDILARLRGQSISTVVERAVMEAADAAAVGHGKELKTWRDFWHVSEAVRALNVAAEPRLYPTYEDECTVQFCRVHWPFFYVSATSSYVRHAYAEIIWPKIGEYIDMWEKTKSTDRFAAESLCSRPFGARASSRLTGPPNLLLKNPLNSTPKRPPARARAQPARHRGISPKAAT